MLSHLRSGAVAACQLVLAWALVWSYLNLGAAPTEILLTLYLILAATCTVALAATVDVGTRRGETIVVTTIGLTLTLAIATRPSLEAQGFVAATVGWAGYLLTRRVVGHRIKKIIRAAQGIIIFGCAQAIYGISQAIGASATTAPGLPTVATGTLISANHFAALLLVTLALLLGLLVGVLEQTRKQKGRNTEAAAIVWVALIVSSVLGASILLSASRGGALGVFAVIVMFGFTQYALQRGSARIITTGFLAILAFATLGLALGLGIDPLVSDLQRHGVGNRPVMFRNTLQLIGDHPWVGVGPGLFGWRVRPYQEAGLAVRWEHVENDLLHVAAEWGLPAALLLAGLILWTLGRLLQLAWHARAHRGVALGLAGALFALLFAGLAEAQLAIPATVLLLGVLLGLSHGLMKALSGERMLQPKDGPKGRAKGRRKGEALTSSHPTEGSEGRARLDLVAKTLLASALIYSISATLPRLEAALIANAPNEVGVLSEAVGRDPEAPHLRYRLGQAYRERGNPGDLQNGIQQLREATRLNPYRWTYLEKLADFYDSAGQHDLAEATLRRELEFNPRDPEAHWLLGSLLLRRERPSEALPPLKMAATGGAPLLRLVLASLADSGLDAPSLSTVVPDDGASAREFLVFVRQREMDELSVERLDEFWRRFLEDPGPTSMKQDFYLQSLIRRGEAKAARRVWSELGTAVGLNDSRYLDGDLIWNGDFDYPVSGAPLDWTPGRGGFALSLTYDEAQASQTTRMDFDGVNACGRILVQRPMTTEPGTHELSLRFKHHSTPSDPLVELSVRPATGGSDLAQLNLPGDTRTWVDAQANVEIPDGVSRLTLEFRCGSSTELQTHSGSLWIDKVQLRRVRQRQP